MTTSSLKIVFWLFRQAMATLFDSIELSLVFSQPSPSTRALREATGKLSSVISYPESPLTGSTVWIYCRALSDPVVFDLLIYH